jgi:hypothetical protein
VLGVTTTSVLACAAWVCLFALCMSFFGCGLVFYCEGRGKGALASAWADGHGREATMVARM